MRKLQKLNKTQLNSNVIQSTKEYPKPVRIVILLATLLPVIHVFFFMTVVFSSFISHGNKIKDIMPILLFSHFASILISFALIGFYIAHIFKSNKIDKDKKALWAVVIFLGNIMAMPVYWYLYIWKEEEQIAK